MFCCSRDSFESDGVRSNDLYPLADCATVTSEGTSELTADGSISDEDSHNSTTKRRKVSTTNNRGAKKSSINHSLVKLPRVLKSDIRRNYANIFSNVMNSADEDLTRAFFKRFTRPTFSLSFAVKDAAHNILEEKIFHGRGNVFRYFMSKYAALPDLFTRISEAKLRTSTAWDGKSELIAAMTVTGTQLYTIPEQNQLCEAKQPTNHPQVEELTVTLPTPKDKGINRVSEVEKHQKMLLGKKRKSIRSVSTSQHVVDEIADFDDEFKKLRISPMLLPNPVHLECRSTIRFTLDEN